MNGTQWGSLLLHMCGGPFCHYDECPRACLTVGGFHKETWHGEVLDCSLTRQSPLTQSNKLQTQSDPHLDTERNTEITHIHAQDIMSYTQHAWEHTHKSTLCIQYVYRPKCPYTDIQTHHVQRLLTSVFASRRKKQRENIGGHELWNSRAWVVNYRAVPSVD